MKSQLILFNALSVVAYLIWLGYHFVKGLSLAFSQASPASGPGDITFLFVIIGIALGGCAIGSFFAPAGLARIIALAPIALVLIGQGFIGYREGANRERFRIQRAAVRSARQKKLVGISRDYVLTEVIPGPGVADCEASFLTLDRELNVIVRIDVGFESEVSACELGRINGDVLETLEFGAGFEKLYRQYVDPAGKSIFDRYTVRHHPDQDRNYYRLDKYGR
jgi:hypothetical protein